jgi:phage-related protein
VEAWPLWTIVGPAVNPTLTNNTTGKSIALTISLTVGQSLTIDTRPGFKTITRENGSNQFSAASPASSLWSLARGLNTITLSVTGSSGASQLQLQYKQRYEGV